MAKSKKQYKSFKLHTNQNIMGVVMFSMLAAMVGALIGIVMLYSSSGQAVLGAATDVLK
jgi:zinc transporter ZupT